ncbi:(4Fe-4S)-binding protein [Anaerocolumna sedimenticola]|uniref:(4Fe-4S)-binding protein n=1 Tax=Anaerocolumna sedimenticola TaxID=2696063 RepID=A0A6P1TEI4_9FIRM|nr:EFR1 family ferrodoxin [Anaerocolumna sedimenticola]QHQ59574.1 (4Fe-4S)-binding protein [Anaerocolumna sedimenticola]
MVIYYSSTGNSKHVALKLHETFKGDLIDVGKFNKPATFYLEDDETLFLVTFNCFWGISNRVETFIQKSEFNNVSKIIVVITCGGYLGGGDASIEKLFSEKGLPKPTVYSLVMVTNYSILHDVPVLETQKKKLIRAEKVLNKIIQGTQKSYHSNWLIRRLTPWVHSRYEKARSTSPFTVNPSCISCKLCEKNCPVQAIEMKENKPFWILPKCDNCLCCLHHCPVKAINYGDSTRNRLQYTYESGSQELL